MVRAPRASEMAEILNPADGEDEKDEGRHLERMIEPYSG